MKSFHLPAFVVSIILAACASPDTSYDSPDSFSFDVPASTPEAGLGAAIEKAFLEKYLARDTSRTASGKIVSATVMSYDSATDQISCVPGYAIMLVDDQKETSEWETFDYKTYFFTGVDNHYQVWDYPIVIEGSREDSEINVDIVLSYSANEQCPIFAISQSHSTGVLGLFTSSLSFYHWSEGKHRLVQVMDLQTGYSSQIDHLSYSGEVAFLRTDTNPYEAEYKVSGDTSYTDHFNWENGGYVLKQETMDESIDESMEVDRNASKSTPAPEWVGLSIDSVQSLNGRPFYLTYYSGQLFLNNWEQGQLLGKRLHLVFSLDPSNKPEVLVSSQEIRDRKWAATVTSARIYPPEEFDESAEPCKGIVGEYPFASYRLLTNADIENRQDVLRIMRNEIFARHGYIFKSDDLKQYFEDTLWYKPQFESTDMLPLSEIEKKNIEFLLQAEEKLKS